MWKKVSVTTIRWNEKVVNLTRFGIVKWVQQVTTGVAKDMSVKVVRVIT